MLHYALLDMKYVESAIKMADFDSVSYIESHNIWTTHDKRLFYNTRLLKDDFLQIIEFVHIYHLLRMVWLINLHEMETASITQCLWY